MKRIELRVFESAPFPLPFGLLVVEEEAEADVEVELVVVEEVEVELVVVVVVVVDFVVVVVFDVVVVVVVGPGKSPPRQPKWNEPGHFLGSLVQPYDWSTKLKSRNSPSGQVNACPGFTLVSSFFAP